MRLLDKADKLDTVINVLAIPVSGALAYGSLYVVYSVFYGRFHVQPPEVGLGKTEMLSRSWPLLVALTVALVLSVVVVGAALTNRDRAFQPLLVLWLVVTLVLGGALGGMWSLISQGSRRVQTGKSLLDVELLGVPLLSPRVRPVYALKFQSDSILTRVDTLMYLGEAKGSYVVYDYQSGQTHWLPVDKVSRLCTEQAPIKGRCATTAAPREGAP